MEKIRQIRIQQELNALNKNKAQNKLASNIEYEFLLKDGLPDDYKLKVYISGRAGSLWESHKRIEGVLSFPANYPIDPPQFKFSENFKHIHVYQGGTVCLPLISQDIWEANTSLFNILSQVEELIHRNPNLASPANSDLSALYSKDFNEYKSFIQSQAQQFSNQQ